MKSVIITLFLLSRLGAQTQIPYAASTGNVSLSSSTTSASLVQPSTNTLTVGFPSSPVTGASIYCSAACVATISVGGTLSGGTPGTVVPLNNPSPAAVVTFQTGASVSNGTTLPVLNIGAGSTQQIDMGAMHLGGPGSNITISIASVTATVNISFYPVEVH